MTIIGLFLICFAIAGLVALLIWMIPNMQPMYKRVLIGLGLILIVGVILQATGVWQELTRAMVPSLSTK